jgi:hypothetical protein
MSLHGLKSSIVARGLLAGIALFLLASCALFPDRRPPELIVAERIQARWDALLAKRFADAYVFATPAFRGFISAERYAGRFRGPVQWVAVEVTEVVCKEPDNCKAKVNLTYRLTAPRALGPFTTSIDETWLKEDGQWWYYEPL